MTVAVADDFDLEVNALDVNDSSAVRALVLKLEALEDPPRATELCARSNTLKRALGLVRAETLAALLARGAHDEFIKRTSNAEYMAPVDVSALRVPRYVAVTEHACKCGAGLMVPYPRQGGPGFGFECPACATPLLVRVVYSEGEYAAQIELDLRPAKKRKKREPVL